MFKIIGAAVVYGFALFGLVTYLEASTDEKESAPRAGEPRSLHVVRS